MAEEYDKADLAGYTERILQGVKIIDSSIEQIKTLPEIPKAIRPKIINNGKEIPVIFITGKTETEDSCRENEFNEGEIIGFHKG